MAQMQRRCVLPIQRFAIILPILLMKGGDAHFKLEESVVSLTERIGPSRQDLNPRFWISTKKQSTTRQESVIYLIRILIPLMHLYHSSPLKTFHHVK